MLSSPSLLQILSLKLPHTTNNKNPIMFHHLHSLFFTLSAIFTLYSLSEAVLNDFYMCSPKEYTCSGNTINISYPFRLQTSGGHCAYPGFNLICNSDNTTLVANIGGRDYKVINIDYINKQLHIVDLNFTDGGPCPQNFTNVTFDSAQFDYIHSNANVTVYLNCSSNLAKTFPHLLVPNTCLPSDSGLVSYFSLNLYPAPMDAWHMCDSVVYVPIYQQPTDVTMMSDMNWFWGALKGGFMLEWKVGDGWCDECEKSNGVCGYNSSATNDEACFCSNSASIDGTCRDKLSPPKHESEF